MEQRLPSEAKALLEQGKVDYIVGFEPGSLKFTTTPLITKDKGDTDRLVVNPFVVNNLANFLIELKGRVGIVVKGCDSRSIVSLIQDNKVAREDVVILGIPCLGIIDLSKVEKLTGKDRDELDDIAREGDKVVIRQTYCGTHTGEFMSIAPTGKQVTTTGITIFRLANGKIAEIWANYDQLGMMQQLGVVPPMGESGE